MSSNRPPAPTADPAYRQFLRESNWRPTTKRQAHYDLNRWAHYLAERATTPLEATRTDVVDYLHDRLAGGIVGTTAGQELRSIRGFYRWATDPDVAFCERDPTRGVKAPEVTESAAPALGDEDYADMVRHTDHRTEGGRRDIAVMSLLRRSGLRRSEICAVDLEDYDPAVETIAVGSTRRPTKTGRPRIVPLAPETVNAIDRYLLKRGEEPGPLFHSNRRTVRLTPNGVTQLVDRARLRANIPQPIGVHTFRRAFAIDCKRQGLSDPALMSIAGWRSTLMIGRYTRSAEAELAHAEFRAKVAKPARRPYKPRLKSVG